MMVGYYLKKLPSEIRAMSLDDLARSFEWIRHCRQEELKQSLQMQGVQI